MFIYIVLLYKLLAKSEQIMVDDAVITITQDVHKLIRYMLTPSADERPDIFQVFKTAHECFFLDKTVSDWQPLF